MTQLTNMDLTLCPQCGALAEVLWREVMESTDGAVEHAKISCVQRHWFLLQVAHLERPDIAVREPACERGA